MKNITESQRDEILYRLLDGQKLTQKIAIEQYHCYRLGARIHELRKPEYGAIPIQTRTVRVTNAIGQDTHWTEYWLDPAYIAEYRRQV